MEPIIKCHNVCKAFGGVIANDKISLEVAPRDGSPA